MKIWEKQIHVIASTLFVAFLTVGAWGTLTDVALAVERQMVVTGPNGERFASGQAKALDDFALGNFNAATSYALVVGVDLYDSNDARVPNLTCASKDAFMLREALLKLGFRSENITYYTSYFGYEIATENGLPVVTEGEKTGKSGPGQQPTRANIIKGLLDIVEKMQNAPENSMLFVSFSGHGFETVSDEKKAAFAPCDVRFKDDAIDRDSVVLLDAVVDVLQGKSVNASFGAGAQEKDPTLPKGLAFKVLVIDACRTPAGVKGAKGNVLLSLNDTAGIAYLQSCASGQSSFEDRSKGKGYGVFTYNLVKALLTADPNGVSFTSVLSRTTNGTQRYVRNELEETQVPAYTVNFTDFYVQKPIDVARICRYARGFLFGISASKQDKEEDDLRVEGSSNSAPDGKIDWAKAEAKLKEAKGFGSAEAAALLLWMKIRRGEAVSEKELYNVAQNSEEQGDPWGLWIFGYCRANGIGVARNDVDAQAYFKSAFKLFTSEKGDRGEELWRRDPATRYAVGLCYAQGWGVAVSSKKAAEYFGDFSWREMTTLSDGTVAPTTRTSKAAVSAGRELGTRYLYGRGVPKNETRGIALLKSAAEKGDLFANGIVGAAYCNGKGGSKEERYSEAKKLFAPDEVWSEMMEPKSEPANPIDVADPSFRYYADPSIRYYMGIYCERGVGGEEQDLDKARELYEWAANRHCAVAQLRLAQAYLNGELGGEKNAEKAIEWFKRAADQNSRQAVRALIDLTTGSERATYEARLKEIDKAMYL